MLTLTRNNQFRGGQMRNDRLRVALVYQGTAVVLSHRRPHIPSVSCRDGKDNNRAR